MHVNIHYGIRFLQPRLMIRFLQSRNCKQSDAVHTDVICHHCRRVLWSIQQANKKPAILRITKPYFKEYISKLSQLDLPKRFVDFYNPDVLSMIYTELLRESEKSQQMLRYIFLFFSDILIYFHNSLWSRLVSWWKKQESSHPVNCGLHTELAG